MDDIKISKGRFDELAGRRTPKPFESYEPSWRTLDTVEPEETSWFWLNLIPSLNAILFAGNGGIGKSLVLLSLISHVTNGKPFICCGTSVHLPVGSVILMSAEGRDETDVVPKLIAAGADRSRIHSITSSVGKISKKRFLLQLDKDLFILEDKIKELLTTDSPVRLIVADPITYFTGDIKDHIQRDVANFLNQLSDLAKTYGLTLLFNKHRRKQTGGQTFASLSDEVGGTAAWVNSPRQAIGFIKHPKLPNVFLMGSIKSNSTKESGISYPYTIEGVKIIHKNQEINTTKLVWGDKPESINLNDASSTELYEKTKTQLCGEIIFNYIKENGITGRKTVIEICEKSGINERMRQRVIESMKKSKEIIEIFGAGQTQYQLGDDFEKFKK